MYREAYFLKNHYKNHSSISRLIRYQSPATADAEPLRRAMAHLDRAVRGLRESGNMDDFPRGLLARAQCRRLLNNAQGAGEDLQEAYQMITQGDMKLFLVDYYRRKENSDYC